MPPSWRQNQPRKQKDESMDKILIFDTNIIISAPEVLSRKKQGVQIIVPEAVISEISYLIRKNRASNELLILVNDAAKAGNIIIQKIEPEEFQVPFAVTQYGISPTDVSFIAMTQFYSKSNSDCFLVTQDKRLIQAAKEYSLKCMTLDNLKQIFTKESTTNSAIKATAERYKRKELQQLFVGIIIGILLTTAIITGYHFRTFLFESMPVWITVLFLIALAAITYQIRQRLRLPYAVVEILFGLIVANKAFFPDYDWSAIGLGTWIQVFAGLYITVRGQDNLGKALENTRYQQMWCRFIGGK
jgi:rRNA-processing protein FCF1